MISMLPTINATGIIIGSAWTHVKYICSKIARLTIALPAFGLLEISFKILKVKANKLKR
jgi:hypothetical protein